MTRGVFDGLPLCELHGDLLRNIKGIRVSQDLYDDLSDDPEDWKLAIDTELRSKPVPLREPKVIYRPFDRAAWREAVRFPFEHWARSPFSDGRYGVWYGSDKLKTTVFETVYHWIRMLRTAGFDRHDREIVGERRVYRVRCDAALLDFRDRVGAFPTLVDSEDYGFTQEVGRRIRREGHPGLINRSARCDGDVHALFSPKVLSDPRNHCDLTYRLDPNRADAVRVERKPGRTAWRVRI
ncbi:MAG: RES family NAD+ phosphorylase [Pseudomonadota bacterium]|nr:RES family NAD+ phosphorylase [Pseudomonadota bacterium]